MAVDTRKFSHTMFYSSQIIGAEYAKSGLHGHLKALGHLPARIKDKADFIIVYTAKGSFKVVEMKKSVGRAGVRQISAYLQMPVVAGEHYILRPEREVHHRGIFVREEIETLPKLVKVAQPIEISYPNQALVETLLGSKGKHALSQVLSIVQSLAQKMSWPLDRVEIRYACDAEVKDWEYVLLLLVFTCDFNTADRHLHELYNQIDMISGELSNEEQEVLRRMIFFDIETKPTVPSA